MSFLSDSDMQFFNTFNLVVLQRPNEEAAYQELLKQVIRIGKDNKFQRLQGNIYKQIDGKSYGYEQWMSSVDFMNHYFRNDTLFRSVGMNKMKKWLFEYDSSQFPLLKRNKDYIGFKNAVLDLNSKEVIDDKAFSKGFPTIVCHHYLSIDYTPDFETPYFYNCTMLCQPSAILPSFTHADNDENVASVVTQEIVDANDKSRIKAYRIIQKILGTKYDEKLGDLQFNFGYTEVLWPFMDQKKRCCLATSHYSHTGPKNGFIEWLKTDRYTIYYYFDIIH